MNQCEEFEQWAEAHFMTPDLSNFRAGKNGELFSYNDDDIEIAWDGWQAAQQSQSERIAELEAEIESENKWASEYATKALELEAENERLRVSIKSIQGQAFSSLSGRQAVWDIANEALKEAGK